MLPVTPFSRYLVVAGGRHATNSYSSQTGKSKEKPYKLSDDKGMFLLVNSNGSKYWRLTYRYGDKERLLALGVYPDLPLADAHDKCDETIHQRAMTKGRTLTQRKVSNLRLAGWTGKSRREKYLLKKGADWYHILQRRALLITGSHRSQSTSRQTFWC